MSQLKPRPAPSVPRTPVEATILGVEPPVPMPSIQVATVVRDASRAWVLVVLELAADGRWRELRRSEPTGRSWAETQLLDELHRQKLARDLV